MSGDELTNSKEQASSISISGDGFNFEHSVQAFFIVQMITGGLVPRMDNGEVIRIVLQAGRYGRKTDDCEVTLKDRLIGTERTLLVQIKRSFNLRPSNKDFTKTIKYAWEDFNSQEFNKTSDKIMLVTGNLDRNGVGLKSMLTHIQGSYQSAGQFWNDYKNNLFGRSDSEVEGLKRLHKKILEINNGVSVDEEEEFNFLKSFFIVRSDMHKSLFEYGDINIVLIHSILAQRKWKNDVKPQTVWERLHNYIAALNEDQIELLKSDPPKKLLEIFEEEKIIQQIDVIPPTDKKQSLEGSELSKNELEINTKYKKDLALLCLVGKFDSSSSNDQKIVSELLGKDCGSALDTVQSIASTDGQIIKLNDTVWEIPNIKSILERLSDYIYDNHIDAFANIYLKVLSEIDPALDLPADERYLSNVYGKKRTYSDAIRKGVANGMAMLANNQNIFSRCSANKVDNVANQTVTKLLFDNQNPKLWMSITDNASLISQAAPTLFLSKLENALKIKDGSPVVTMIKESAGDSFFQTDYMTGLRWALADLSWDKKHFSQSILALAKISAYEISQSKKQNCSIDIILHTILPWRPKTFASVEVQHNIVERIIDKYKIVGWRLLEYLLPNATLTTIEREAPEWLTVGNDDSKPVTQQELWEQNSYYSNLYVATAESPQDIIDVIKNVSHLTGDAFDNFATRLSELLKHVTDKDKRFIWEVLLKKVNELNRYTEGEDERAKKLKEVANCIEPADDLYKSIYLFNNYDHDLIGHRDWREGLNDIRKKRQHMLLSILESRDTNQLSELINQTKLSHLVGSTLGYVNYSTLESELLPKFINDNRTDKELEFIRSFIYARYFYHEGSVDWVDRLGFANWNNEQKILFALSLPFSKKVWNLLDRQRNKYITKEYWIRVNDFRHAIDDEYSESATKNLLRAKRPLAAIEYIYWALMKDDNFSKQGVDVGQCLEVLLASLSTPENIYNHNGMQLEQEASKIFTYLHRKSDYTKTDLWKAEWGYLMMFHKHGTEQPRALTYRIANDADFFCELIKIAYKSDHPDAEQQEIDEPIQHRLLKILSFNDFTIMPGVDQYGVFHKDNFIAWLNRVEEACKASGHLNAAQSVIGSYLINSPEDKSGLWIHKIVAKVLDRDNSASMRSGYKTGVYNARGVHAVDTTGQTEASLRDKWQNRADEVDLLGLPNLAVSLRELAKAYERERNRVIKQGLSID